MTNDIIPFPDEDDAPLSDADAKRIIEAAKDPVNIHLLPVKGFNGMLADLRRARRMSQQQLASAIGNPRGQAQISRYESLSNPEIPDEQTVARIAEALDVDPVLLLRARLLSVPAKIEYGIDPRWLLLWDRLAHLDPLVQDAAVILIEALIRFAETIIAVYRKDD